MSLLLADATCLAVEHVANGYVFPLFLRIDGGGVSVRNFVTASASSRA